MDGKEAAPIIQPKEPERPRPPPVAHHGQKLSDAVVLAAVCGEGNVTISKESKGCKECPAFLGVDTVHEEPQIAFAVKVIQRGSFTGPGVEQAAVTLWGCGMWGGTALVELQDDHVTFLRYEDGFSPVECRPQANADGRTLLLCREGQARQGMIVTTVLVRDFAIPWDTNRPNALLDAKDTIGNLCDMTTDDEDGPWFDFSMLSFDWTFLKGDRVPDVLIKVRYSTLAGRAGPHRKHCSAMTPYLKARRKGADLTFEGNGQGWLPTPATGNTMSKLGDPHQ